MFRKMSVALSVLFLGAALFATVKLQSADDFGEKEDEVKESLPHPDEVTRSIVDRERKGREARAAALEKGLEIQMALKRSPEEARRDDEEINDRMRKNLESKKSALKTLAEALDSQEPDPEWSKEVSSYAERYLEEAELSELDLVDVTCVADFCRIQIVSEDLDAIMAFAERSNRTGIWHRGDVFGTIDIDDFETENPDLKAVNIYFTEEGKKLPAKPLGV